MSLLDDYRTQIDSIDAKLVPLFLERMAVTQKVGEYKKQNGLPVLDSGREQEVIAAKTAPPPDFLERLSTPGDFPGSTMCFGLWQRGRRTMRCSPSRTPPPAPSGRSMTCWPSMTFPLWGSGR